MGWWRARFRGDCVRRERDSSFWTRWSPTSRRDGSGRRAGEAARCGAHHRGGAAALHLIDGKAALVEAVGEQAEGAVYADETARIGDRLLGETRGAEASGKAGGE